jgi:hypothetical protein
MNDDAVCSLCRMIELIAWSAIAVAAAGGVALAVVDLLHITIGPAP